MRALGSALRTRLCIRYGVAGSGAATVQKTAAARVRAAAECIEETLTSLTALLNNSLIDSPLLAASAGSSQAERSLFGFERPVLRAGL
jgi:hypothetical protein